MPTVKNSSAWFVAESSEECEGSSVETAAIERKRFENVDGRRDRPSVFSGIPGLGLYSPTFATMCCQTYNRISVWLRVLQDIV